MLKKGVGDSLFLFRPTDCTYAEYLALVALYNATDGDNWTDNTNWLTDTTVNNWYGVTTAGGKVTQVDLNTNNLNGSLAAWDVEIGRASWRERVLS